VLRAQENRNRAVRILKGNITANSRNESRGISARVGRDGLFGFASIAEYSEEAAKKVLSYSQSTTSLLCFYIFSVVVSPWILALQVLLTTSGLALPRWNQVLLRL
jgi:hypothetical protein